MENRLRILLLRPRPPKETIGLQHVMICEPLELEYLVGNIDKTKASVKIIDMILEKKPIEFFINKYKPHIVGMTAYITHVGAVKEMARKIKRLSNKTITVVGGVHAEVVPEDFASKYIDCIICSNPVETFIKIIDRVRAGEDTKEIEGTYVKGKKHIRTSSYNILPPDRSSVKKYRKKYYYMFHNPCALIKTSLGCPYTCSFCFCKEITGGKYFARKIDEVMEELESIKEREIYIVDDDFLFNENRLNLFCDELEKRNIHKRFLVYGRADFIASHEKVIGRLSRHGLSAVIVGVESVREKDLKDFNKRSSLENNEKAIRILQKYGIELYATMILQPDFTKKDFRQIEDYIIGLNVSFVNLQPLTPLPGTEIYDDYKDKILVSRKDYAMWDLAHIVLEPKYMSIRQYYYQIIKTYARIVLRPDNIIKMLKKYGIKEVAKMWWGSQFVSLQYIGKIIRGR
ncbi:MAG: radical SAM protein [Lachnospiraceae bacterium]|nr:MAG: radical SAM protein [Lachnospiraceae bacterium]